MWKNVIIVAVLLIIVIGGAYWLTSKSQTSDINAQSSVQTLVSQFGSTLQKVSLSAPDAKDEIGAAYSPYVTADLLKKWQDNIPFAPGRGLSSPWPDRIQIDSTTQNGDTYVVKGTVIEVTSQEVTQGGVAATYPVTITVVKQGGQWLISGYEPGPEVVGDTTTQASTTTTQ